MIEFLIQADDGRDLWPAFHKDRNNDVLTPQDWDAVPIDGWGDHRVKIGAVEISFSGEEAGWQVSFEGEIDADRAAAIVATIAEQISRETGRPVRVIDL